ncbi:MAG: 30S ribosomal protein S16 [Gemmatimonadota bacterium]
MPTTIRLQRTGRKKQASFRIVVTDQSESRDGPALETLGTYNPRTQPSLIKVNAGSALNWLYEGAQPTDTVVSIFKKTGVWEHYRKGTTADALSEEESTVELGGDPKTSRRAADAAEGEKLAATRRAEEKATAEAEARKAADEKKAEAKAAAEAAEAEAAEAADAAAEVETADAAAEEAPEAAADEADETEAAAEAPEAAADEAPEAAADEADETDAADDGADKATDEK